MTHSQTSGQVNTDKDNKMAGKGRTTGGIVGPGARNVAPVYKSLQPGLYSTLTPVGPKPPSKKKGPSFIDKFIAGFKKEMTRPTQRVRSTDGDKKP